MIEIKKAKKVKREAKNYKIKYIFNTAMVLIILNLQEDFSYVNSMEVKNKDNKRRLEGGENNEISLVIDKNLGTRIINSNYQSNISQIIINGNPESAINVDLSGSTFLVEGFNNITIKFNKQLTNCFQMFYELNNIISVDLSNFDFSSMLYMRYTFYNCSSLKSIKMKNDGDLPRINMERMFLGCNSLTTLDLSNWKSNHLGYTFFNCFSLSSLNLNNFDTSQVVAMNYTFYYCNSLESIDLRSFNTGSADNFRYLFYHCIYLKSLDLDHFDTSKVKDMRGMFASCTNLTTIKINNFNTSLITTMLDMFRSCKLLKSLNIGSFNTSNVDCIGYMFYGCNSLETLDLSHFDVSKITQMNYTFAGCVELISLNLGSFNANCVENTDYMFYNCRKLTSLDLSNFNSKSILDMKYMFQNCYCLRYLDLSSFDTSSLISLEGTFINCYSLTSINFSNWKTSSLTTFNYTFVNCSSLKSLDLSNFNTSSVDKMHQLFQNCSSLESLDLSNFDTSLVTEMRAMFRYCYNLTYLNISNFNTSKITRMSEMFRECKSLTSLDLSSFKTSSVMYFDYMFDSCSSLESLDLSNFDTSSATQMLYMFNGCKNLKYLNISNFNTSLVNHMAYMFSNCSSLLSLNLSNFDTSITTQKENIFLNANLNLTYCIDENKTYVFSYELANFKKDCKYICEYFFGQKFIKNKVQCIETCFDDDTNQYEYNNICYEKCPNNSKLVNNNSFLCIDNCTKIDYPYEFNNICYKECPINSKLISNSYLCIDNCSNSIDYQYEYNNTCYNECPINSKQIYNSFLCIDNCTSSIDYQYEYNNSCYKECPNNFKPIYNGYNSYLCIDNCMNSIDYPYEYNNRCYNECPINSKQIYNSYLCIDNCTNSIDYQYEYNNRCYNECPFNSKQIYNTYLCIDNCTNSINYQYEYNNTCYNECPIDSKLIYNTYLCIDNCSNSIDYQYEYNNICYNECPINCKLINNSLMCIDNCTNNIDFQYEYNNSCYKECPINFKSIYNNYLCIDNCTNSIDYKYEFNNTCYKECPINTKLIYNSYLCIDNCYNSIDYQYEYNNICYNECPINSKLINKSFLCIDNCTNSLDYQYEYNNMCYKECPLDSKLINNTYLCIDNCTNSIYYQYEYNNQCYKECPNNSKLIEINYLCIDTCLDDEVYKYEYKNKCYEKCPSNTFYYNEDKFCYDEIPDGFYCNDTMKNTLDKCHENCKTCNEGPKIGNNNCLSCPDTGNIYLNLGNCTNNCSKGFFIYENSIKICKCIYDKCNYCSNKSIKSNLCISCNNDEDYYQKNDNEFSLEGFINCYKNPEGYYLEKNLYQKCYKSCKKCVTLGNEDNHKCLECYENYTFTKDFDNLTNCYNKCEFYYYYDKESNNKYQCTLENKCPEKYSKSIEDKRRCIDSCYNDNIYKYEYNNKCYNSCPKGTVLSFNISFLCKDIAELQKYKSEPAILEKVLNLSDKDISIDVINSITSEYLENVANYTNFVTKVVSDNYKLYVYKDSSSLEETAEEAPQIDFGGCYEKVKKYYNIKDNPLVTIINNETDKTIYGKASNKYTFSHPDTGKVLNTTGICSEEDKIIVKENINALLKDVDEQKEEYIRYLAKQGIDVFDLSNRFYCDLCYYFESPNNRDIPLKDRITNFFPNITLCDPGCDNLGVDLEKMKAKCECTFNNLLNNNILNTLNYGVISEVVDIINLLNLNVFQCFKDIFNPKYFKKCIGGFIMLGCLIIQLICAVKFLSDGLYRIRKYIISLSDSFYLYKTKNNISNPPKKKRSRTTRKSLQKLNIDNNSQNSNNKIMKNSLLDNANIRGLNKKENTIIFNKFNIYGNPNQKSEKNEKLNINHINNTEEKNKYCKKIDEYLNDSYDENDFCDVLDKETRSFKSYFCEKFKNNQIIINTFYIKDLFKPRAFKIILFIITIELYFVINALFYNEEYLSLLFNSKEREYFFSFVPRRISDFFYTSVVSIIILYLIGCFSIEEEKIKRIFIRFHKEETKMRCELSLVVKTIKKRFILFIIFSLFLSTISFFYICCFNIVYPYIRIEWIKSSIFIIIVMEIINFIFTFFECCIRYLAILCNSEKLFKISLLFN